MVQNMSGKKPVQLWVNSRSKEFVQKKYFSSSCTSCSLVPQQQLAPGYLQLQRSSDLHGWLTFFSFFAFWIFSSWHLDAWYRSSMYNTLRYVTVLLSVLLIWILRTNFPALLPLSYITRHDPIFWTQLKVNKEVFKKSLNDGKILSLILN